MGKDREWKVREEREIIAISSYRILFHDVMIV